jgi:dCMP deaminase
MNYSKEDIWLAVAGIISLQSTCLRREVGCVLTDERQQVISTGYNGVASKLHHCNHWVPDIGVMLEIGAGTHPYACPGAHKAKPGENLDMCQAIHAEQNALLQCRRPYDIRTCYVTHSPCVTCVKLLMNTSCYRIIFRTPYAHDEQARKLWESMNRGPWLHFKGDHTP